MKKWLYMVVLLLASTMVRANGDTLYVAECDANTGFNDTIDRNVDDFVVVSLLVCEPYETLYSSLGHAALRLQCPAHDLDYVFSYEGENVRAKIWTFLRGDLKMGLFAFPTDLFLKVYETVGRGVTAYQLNLSPQQDQELWRILDEMRTAGMTLPYDYFKRGCAKSVVDVVKRTVGPNGIHYAPWPEKYAEHTIRELVRDYMNDMPWTAFMLYFLIGSEAEQPMSCEQKLIVPTDLVEVWQQATFDSGKSVLSAEGEELVPGSMERKQTIFTPFLVALLLLLMAIGALWTLRTENRAWRMVGEMMDYIVLAVSTLLGILMTYLVCFSSLPCTQWNWLLIPFNVLPVLAWFVRRYWAIGYAIIIVVWCTVMTGMLIWGHVIVDWSHILLTLAFGMVLLHQGIQMKIYIKSNK